MKSAEILLVSFTILNIISYTAASEKTNASDFDFNFSGYKNIAKLLVIDCNVQDLHKEINHFLGGVKGAIQQPHNSENISHITCVDDPYMGKAINLTLYKMDDPPKRAHMQRLELKAVNRSKSLSAHRNDDNIYSWWFQLDPLLTSESGQFSIFTLKGEGHHSSLASFNMNKKLGLFLRVAANNTQKYPLAPLSAVRGTWIQAFVQVFYAEVAGFIRVILKDRMGNQLFPTANQTGVFLVDTFHPEWKSVKPRWGLNRKVSPDYPNVEYQLLQNLQVWKKI